MAKTPIMTREIADGMPHPDRAWMLRPQYETQPMYDLNKQTGYMINLKNYCMRTEYEKLRAENGIGLGEAVPRALRVQWERDMIEKYDPETACFIFMFEQIGAQA